ncbi:Uma2 family endonuclease [Chamaesiphon sp. GL140_3_metabinner_50]|uniref:Uma2 family endonuclease n=1 Tax=Chamaesiphon sp. GL140_3_metabinner_50 TaxID=2970812 RepID=UPI0025E8013C|nr:Uma2 family endonuclease [Chamaesiphon sp. GL140_3_metabinner_50]
MTVSTNSQPLLLNVSNITLTVNAEQYYALNVDNQDLRLELTATGQLFFKPLFVYGIARHVSDLMMEVSLWNKQAKLGTVFGSSMGYDFLEIGGGIMNPDLTWIAKSRTEAISGDIFCPVVPDFVLEYSPNRDRLVAWQKRMLEYQRLGARLGLLVDVWDKQVEIYRPGQEPEILESPTAIDCGEVMPDFKLSMDRIW